MKEKITKPPIKCAVCKKRPEDIDEYQDEVIAWNEGLPQNESLGAPINEDSYVVDQEGTFNKENNLFVCTTCYLRVGTPSHDLNDPRGNWKPSGFAYYIGNGQYQFETKRNGIL